ncbi:MAG: TSUP family transporter [Acidobacteriota bacterium]
MTFEALRDAVAAGTVDTLAGGGGLITLPVLLSLGLPPQIALGTNKLQSSFGSGSATRHFVKKGAVSLQYYAWGIACTAVGATAGAFSVQLLHADFLNHFIPFLLIAVALYVLFSPRLGRLDRRGRIAPGVFFPLAGLLFGFYDGFFGPGVGSFWVIAMMLGVGFNMQRATAGTKLLNFTSNFVSLVTFAVGGSVYYAAGLVMAAGQVLGGRLGAGLVLKGGTRLIRPIFILVVLVISLKLLFLHS